MASFREQATGHATGLTCSLSKLCQMLQIKAALNAIRVFQQSGNGVRSWSVTMVETGTMLVGSDQRGADDFTALPHRHIGTQLCHGTRPDEHIRYLSAHCPVVLSASPMLGCQKMLAVMPTIDRRWNCGWRCICGRFGCR